MVVRGGSVGPGADILALLRGLISVWISEALDSDVSSSLESSGITGSGSLYWGGGTQSAWISFQAYSASVLSSL